MRAKVKLIAKLHNSEEFRKSRYLRRWYKAWQGLEGRLAVSNLNYLVKLQMFGVVTPEDCQTLQATETILGNKTLVEQKLNSSQRTVLERHFSFVNLLKQHISLIRSDIYRLNLPSSGNRSNFPAQWGTRRGLKRDLEWNRSRVLKYKRLLERG